MFVNKISSKLRRVVGQYKYPDSVRKVVQTRINNHDLLVLANEVVGREINSVGNYEKQETEFFSKIIKLTDTCVDVGANVGYYTFLMALHANSGNVHAFEPIPLNYHLLCASVALNRFRNISISQCAVGEENRETSFSESSDSAFSSIIDVGHKPIIATFKTKIVTLDEYLATNRIEKVDVMKVDVEGAEFGVIRGAKLLLQKAESRPRVVMLELWDAYQAKYNASIEQVVDQMTVYGYTAFCFDDNCRPQYYDKRYFNVVPNVFFCTSDVDFI